MFKRLPLQLPPPCSIHFIGIGGIGMSGLARILHSAGYKVTGSDQASSVLLTQLVAEGIDIQTNHLPDKVRTASLVILSSAIPESNPERVWAHQAGKTMWHRATLLRAIAEGEKMVAVTGTHGKSSTTALLGHILRSSRRSHTYINGAICHAQQTNAYLGEEWILFETDESDGSLVQFHPDIAILTNLEADHLSAYHHNFEELLQAFQTFASQVQPSGTTIFCRDDPQLAALFPIPYGAHLSYGFHPDADYRLCEFTPQGWNTEVTLLLPQGDRLPLLLNQPGRHHALNATAALIAAVRMGVPIQRAKEALSSYPGIKRRLQLLGKWIQTDGQEIQCFTDYGHHPTEIEASLQALRDALPDYSLLHLFQPHKFSRTQELFPEFLRVLQRSERLILLDTYPAGERTEQGLPSNFLAERLTEVRASPVPCYPCSPDLFPALFSLCQPRTVILFQGAGTIDDLAHAFVQTAFEKRAGFLSPSLCRGPE